MLASLALPIILTAVALFFASFLSWMVLQIHRQDWVKLPDEDGFIAAVRSSGTARGNYAFPTWTTKEEMQSEVFKQKWKTGPAGIITIFPPMNMGRNLALTFVYFLGVSFCVAYLATLALTPGAAPAAVFRFVATAGLIAFLSAILQHAIWFYCRVVGHVIESVVYAIIIGAIFAALWPAA
jgi:hypothetical protein